MQLIGTIQLQHSDDFDWWFSAHYWNGELGTCTGIIGNGFGYWDALGIGLWDSRSDLGFGYSDPREPEDACEAYFPEFCVDGSCTAVHFPLCDGSSSGGSIDITTYDCMWESPNPPPEQPSEDYNLSNFLKNPDMFNPPLEFAHLRCSSDDAFCLEAHTTTYNQIGGLTDGVSIYAETTFSGVWETYDEAYSEYSFIHYLYPGATYRLINYTPLGDIEFCNPLLGCTGFGNGTGLIFGSPGTLTTTELPEGGVFQVITEQPYLEFTVPVIIPEIPFCDSYSCLAEDIFDIQYFNNIPEEPTGTSILLARAQLQGTMTYYSYPGYEEWNGQLTGQTLVAGYGVEGNQANDIPPNLTSYSEDREFCHPGLGCTGFGNGTGIELPVDETVTIFIPTYTAVEGDIYEEPILGCMDETACNYNSEAEFENYTCQYPEECYDCDNNYLCGCTDPNACNYNIEASIDNGTCYNADYPCDDGSFECLSADCPTGILVGQIKLLPDFSDLTGGNGYIRSKYWDHSDGTLGECTANGDNWSTISESGDWPDENQDFGLGFPMMDLSLVCSLYFSQCGSDPNTNPPGIYDCIAVENAECSGSPNNWMAFNCEGIPFTLIEGCTHSSACNYNPEANSNDFSCEYDTTITCYLYEDDDNFWEDSQEITYCYPECPPNWSLFSGDGEGIPGCLDATACNYNVDANADDNSCYYAPGITQCWEDLDGDEDYETEINIALLCDETCGTYGYSTTETTSSGCTDPDACNYDEFADIDNSSCIYENTINCFIDTDGDGYWTQTEIITQCYATCNSGWTEASGYGQEQYGCIEESACNYDSSATENNGTCIFADGICDCDGNIPDGFCNCNGSTNETVCGSIYRDCFNECQCFNDVDNDNLCDESPEEDCVGQYDECNVCNGNGIADGACDCAGNVVDECFICGGLGATIECWDGSAVCDNLEQCPLKPGCTDVIACNYDETTEYNDGSCQYPLINRDCDGTCYNDVDEDDTCDEVDDCIGIYDECGCNEPMPDGACDCDGNVLDDCGICNGDGPTYDCSGTGFNCGQMACFANQCTPPLVSCTNGIACNFGAYNQSCIYFTQCSNGAFMCPEFDECFNIITSAYDMCVNEGYTEEDDLLSQPFGCNDDGLCIELDQNCPIWLSNPPAFFESPFYGKPACNYNSENYWHVIEDCQYSGNVHDFAEGEVYEPYNYYNLTVNCGNGLYACEQDECACGENEVNIFGLCFNINTTEYINFNYSGLTGEIPSQIGNIKSLKDLRLAGNNFTGHLPDSFLNLINLERLDLYDNDLEGYILGGGLIAGKSYNSILQAAAELKYLNINNNNFGGTLSHLRYFSKLEELYASNNFISNALQYWYDNGPFPISETELKKVVLNGNNLTTSVSDSLDIKEFVKLEYLDISNQTSSNFQKIPPDIEKLSNLHYLNLSNNNIIGTIPNTFGYFESLNYLNLSNNDLEGYIPISICETYSNLNFLSLNNNKLCPTISAYPECLSEDDIGYQTTSACTVTPYPIETAVQGRIHWNSTNSTCRGPVNNCDEGSGGEWGDPTESAEECCAQQLGYDYGTFETEAILCGNSGGVGVIYECHIPILDIIYDCEKTYRFTSNLATNISTAINYAWNIFPGIATWNPADCDVDTSDTSSWQFAICCAGGSDTATDGECKDDPYTQLVPMKNPLTGETFFANGKDACADSLIFEDAVYNLIPHFCKTYDCCINCDVCPGGTFGSGIDTDWYDNYVENKECKDGGFFNWNYFTDPIKAEKSDFVIELESMPPTGGITLAYIAYRGFSGPTNDTDCVGNWCTIPIPTSSQGDYDNILNFGLIAGEGVLYPNVDYKIIYTNSVESQLGTADELNPDNDKLTFIHPGFSEPLIMKRNEDVYFSIPETPLASYEHIYGCTDDGNKDITWWEGQNTIGYNYSEAFNDMGYPNYRACNYNPLATTEDGSCEYDSCIGCPDFGSNGNNEALACTCWTSSPECNNNCCISMSGQTCTYDWLNPQNHNCPSNEACIPTIAAGGTPGVDADVCQPTSCSEPENGFVNGLSIWNYEENYWDEDEYIWGCDSNGSFDCCKYFNEGYNPIILPIQLNQYNDVNYEFQSYKNNPLSKGVDISKTNVEIITKNNIDYYQVDGMIPGGASYVSLYPLQTSIENIKPEGGNDVNYYDGIGLLGGGVGQGYDWINSGYPCDVWDTDGLCGGGVGENNSIVGYGSYKFFNEIYSFLTAYPNNNDINIGIDYLSNDPGWLGRIDYVENFVINPYQEKEKHIAPFISLNDVKNIQINSLESTYITVRTQIHPDAMVINDSGEAHLNSYWLSNYTDNLAFPTDPGNRIVLGKGSESMIVNVSVYNINGEESHDFEILPYTPIGPVQSDNTQWSNTNILDFGYIEEANQRFSVDFEAGAFYDIYSSCGIDNHHTLDGDVYGVCSSLQAADGLSGMNIWNMPIPQISDFGSTGLLNETDFNQMDWDLYKSWLYQYAGWWCSSLYSTDNTSGSCEYNNDMISGGSFEGGLAAFIQNCKNPNHNPLNIFGTDVPEGTTQLNFCPKMGTNTPLATINQPYCDSNFNYCVSEKIYETVWEIKPIGYSTSAEATITITAEDLNGGITTQQVNVSKSNPFGIANMNVNIDNNYNHLILPPQGVQNTTGIEGASEYKFDFGYHPFTGKNKNNTFKTVSAPDTSDGNFLEKNVKDTYSGYYAKIPFEINGDAMGAIFGTHKPEIDESTDINIEQIGGGVDNLFCHEHLINNPTFQFDIPCIEFVTGEWADDSNWGIPITGTGHSYKPALVNLELKNYNINYEADGLCLDTENLCNPSDDGSYEFNETGNYYTHCFGKCMPDETQYFYNAYIFPEKEYDKIVNPDNLLVHSEIPNGFSNIDSFAKSVVKYNLKLIIFDGNGEESFELYDNVFNFAITKSTEGDKKYQYERYNGNLFENPFEDILGCLHPYGSNYEFGNINYPTECELLDNVNIQDAFNMYFHSNIDNVIEPQDDTFHISAIDDYENNQQKPVIITLPWRKEYETSLYSGGTCYDINGNVATDIFNNPTKTIEQCFCLNQEDGYLDHIQNNGQPSWTGHCDDETSPICTPLDGIEPKCLFLTYPDYENNINIQVSNSSDDYISNLNCNSLINQDLNINELTAHCSAGEQGTAVTMAEGGNGFINYPNNFQFTNGNLACKSQTNICANGNVPITQGTGGNTNSIIGTNATSNTWVWRRFDEQLDITSVYINVEVDISANCSSFEHGIDSEQVVFGLNTLNNKHLIVNQTNENYNPYGEIFNRNLQYHGLIRSLESYNGVGFGEYTEGFNYLDRGPQWGLRLRNHTEDVDTYKYNFKIPFRVLDQNKVSEFYVHFLNGGNCSDYVNLGIGEENIIYNSPGDCGQTCDDNINRIDINNINVSIPGLTEKTNITTAGTGVEFSGGTTSGENGYFKEIKDSGYLGIKLTPDFWKHNGFNFASIENQKIKINQNNLPSYGMLNDEFLSDELPDWYVNGADGTDDFTYSRINSQSIIDTNGQYISDYFSTSYFLNNAQENFNTTWLENPFEWLCVPFNDVWNDSFGINIELESEYLGESFISKIDDTDIINSTCIEDTIEYCHATDVANCDNSGSDNWENSDFICTDTAGHGAPHYRVSCVLSDGTISNPVLYYNDNAPIYESANVACESLITFYDEYDTTIGYQFETECDTFEVNAEIVSDAYQPITLQVGQLTKTFDFNIMSGKYCEEFEYDENNPTVEDYDYASNVECKTETIYEQIFQNSSWLINDTSPNFNDTDGNPIVSDYERNQEISFEWPYETSSEDGEECSISIILEDAELAADVDNLTLTHLQFSNNNGNSYNDIGNLSSGLHQTIWENQPGDPPDLNFSGNPPGTVGSGDPAGIHWVFTTGFASNIDASGYPNNETGFLAKTYCKTGTNIIRIIGEDDWVKVKHIKVEKLYVDTCPYNRRCGITRKDFTSTMYGEFDGREYGILDVVHGYSGILDNNLNEITSQLFGHTNKNGYCDYINFSSNPVCSGGINHGKECSTSSPVNQPADYCHTATLSKSGLISYDYKMSINLEKSNNVLVPAESFTQLKISSRINNPNELKDFIERNCFSFDTGGNCLEFNTERIIAIDGFRHSVSNNCCNPNKDENCFEREQTNFKIDDIDDSGILSSSENPYIILSGKILNSPYRFCSVFADGYNFEDKIILDSGAGYGSNIYETLYISNGSTEGNCLSSDDINNETDCLDNWVVANSYDDYPIEEDTILYEPLNTQYDGWSQETPPSFTIMNMEEGSVPELWVKIQRHFHNLFGLNPGECSIETVYTEEDCIIQGGEWTSSISDYDFGPINIIVRGINPPHIHFLTYESESKPQFGIQNNNIVSYNNKGSNLISEEYLEINSSQDYGKKAIGNIIFSSWEANTFASSDESQYQTMLILNTPNGQQFELSNIFSIHTQYDNEGNSLYIWDNIIKAINDSASLFTAYLSTYSDPNPSNNLKTVIIEANNTGKQYNGIINWTISDIHYISAPLFTNLTGGELYPVLNVYEDFGYIKLLIAASDFDRLSTLSLSIATTQGENIGLEIIDENIFVNPYGIDWQNGYNFITDGYIYPYLLEYKDFEYNVTETFEELLNIPANGVLNEEGVYEGDSTYNQAQFAHYNSIIKITSIKENWNGEADIILRIVDSDSSFDKVALKLIVHPVNDTPQLKAIGDTNIFKNNENYPNDTNIKIEYSDIEQGQDGIILDSVDIVNDDYCQRVEKATELINSYTVPAFIDGVQVLPDEILLNLYGEELIINGNFDTENLDGWNIGSQPYGNVYYQNGGIRIISYQDGGTGNNAYAQQQVLTPGKEYIFTYDVIDISSSDTTDRNMHLELSGGDLEIPNTLPTNIPSTGNSMIFTSTQTMFTIKRGGKNIDVTFDNISVKEVLFPTNIYGSNDNFTNISCGSDSIYCRSLCYYSFGMSKDNAEELCSFADYNNDNIINNEDVESCNDDVSMEETTGNPESEFRGGINPLCNSKKSLVDLLYEMFAYYGAQVYEHNHLYGGSCNADYTSFVDNDNNPISTIFNDDGCIRPGPACEDFFSQNYFNFCATEPEVGNLETCNSFDSDVDGCNNTNGCFHLSSVICDKLDVNGNGTYGYTDLTELLNGNVTNEDFYFCHGGGKNNSFCEFTSETSTDIDSFNNIYTNFGNYFPSKVDTYCTPHNIPNFLSFNENSSLPEFTNTTGFETLKDYVYIKPQNDSIGTFYIRSGIKDSGLNENGSVSDKRTGFSKFKITIDGGSNEGPTGDITQEEIISFGLSPDSYKFYIGGADVREGIPTTLNRDFSISVYDYHEDTILNNRVLDECNLNNDGLINADGECCSITPITNSNDLKSYFNTDNNKGGTNPIYYEDEYSSKINLYLEYFKGSHSKWCHSQLDSLTWNYSNKFNNRNIYGFQPPNVEFNQLDYTVSYKIEIYDVVENYDNVDNQLYRRWWADLAIKDFEWTQKWNGLRREGWDNLYAVRNADHPLGETCKYENPEDENPTYCVILKSFDFSQNAQDGSSGDIQTLINEGIEFDITWPSIYEFRVITTDTYGTEQITSNYVDARNYVKINQTLLTKFSPWQGFNIVTPEFEDLLNTELFYNDVDRDTRPSLGLWYYNNLLGNIANNQNLNWSIRHNKIGGHAYSDNGITGEFAQSYLPEEEDPLNKYSWFPDADIRSTISLGSSNSVLYKYYDEELQPLAYEESMSPLTAQVFFYPRNPVGLNLITSTAMEDFKAYLGTDPNNPLSHTKRYSVANYDDKEKTWYQVPTRITAGAGTNEYLTGLAETPIIPGETYTLRVLLKFYLTGGNPEFNVEDLRYTFWTTDCSDEGDKGHHSVSQTATILNDFGNNEYELIATYTNDTTCHKLRAPNIRITGNGAEGTATHISVADPVVHQGEYSTEAVDRAVKFDTLYSYQLEGVELPINKQLLNEGRMYVGFLNWGDGSPIEYDKIPLKLGPSGVVKHIYEKSGIYNIRGDMFKVKLDDNGYSEGIINYNEFLFRINVGKNTNEEEFEILGGEGYKFIPYKDDVPVISGVSKYSLYYKLLKTLNGILPIKDLNETIDVKYKYDGEKLESQIALAKIDENYLLPLMSSFTGSFASDQSDSISPEDEIIVSIADDACQYSEELGDGDNQGFICDNEYSSQFEIEFLFSNYEGITNDTYSAAFLDCEDECVTTVLASETRGFFDGQVDENGDLIPEDPNNPFSYKPQLINKGLKNNFGSLGDYLGDSDIAQIRYFNKPTSMWEMLGFECDEIGQRDTIPMDPPNVGCNYRHHSISRINLHPDDSDMGQFAIKAPDGTYTATRLYRANDTGGNEIRFGYKMKILDGQLDPVTEEPIDENYLWYWDQHPNNSVANPMLIPGETYTISTHMYIPSINLTTGEPLGNNGYNISLRHQQTCRLPSGTNEFAEHADWTTAARDDDGTFSDYHGLDILEDGTTNQNSFKYPAFDAYWHCHPTNYEYDGLRDLNVYGWNTTGKPYPMEAVEDDTPMNVLTQLPITEWSYWHNKAGDADATSNVEQFGDEFQFTIIDGGTGASSIQYYETIPITEGMPYTVKFKAKASVDRYLGVHLMDRQADWDNNGLSWNRLGLQQDTLPITTEWTEHTFNFNADGVCQRPGEVQLITNVDFATDEDNDNILSNELTGWTVRSDSATGNTISLSNNQLTFNNQDNYNLYIGSFTEGATDGRTIEHMKTYNVRIHIDSISNHNPRFELGGGTNGLSLQEGWNEFEWTPDFCLYPGYCENIGDQSYPYMGKAVIGRGYNSSEGAYPSNFVLNSVSIKEKHSTQQPCVSGTETNPHASISLYLGNQQGQDYANTTLTIKDFEVKTAEGGQTLDNGNSCWTALTEDVCTGACHWYDEGSYDGYGETVSLINNADIEYDKWFRVSMPFTALDPTTFGNGFSFFVGTQLGDGAYGTCTCPNGDIVIGYRSYCYDENADGVMGSPACGFEESGAFIEGEFETTSHYDDSVYTWGAQLELGNIMSSYTDKDVDPGNCANAYSGNPGNKRYWQNIIPEDLTLEDRTGINALPPLPDLNNQLMEVVFAWGRLNSDGILVNGNIYEFIEIKYSLSPGEEISKIEIVFNGLELPKLYQDSSQSMGGIVDTTIGYQFTVTTENKNKLILNHPGCDNISDVMDCSILTTNNPTENKLLLRVPIARREDDSLISFKSINIYKFESNQNPYILINNIDMYMYNQFGNIYPWVTPNLTQFGSLYINELSPQTWIDDNENSYYYPVLPKVNKIGEFDTPNESKDSGWENDLGLQGSNIPFGSPGRNWDEDDLYAPITSLLLPSNWLNYCLIDLGFDEIEDESIADNSGEPNFGMLIDDYKIDYDKPIISINSKKPTIRTKLGKNNKGKAY